MIPLFYFVSFEEHPSCQAKPTLQGWVMKQAKRYLLLLTLVWLTPVTATESTLEQALSAEDIQAFLTNILGAWRGKAVLTPVGPLPYDITFAPIGDDGAKGLANPGAALHYWRFFKQDKGLGLRFLTTFRGNKQPLYLQAKTRQRNAVVFRAQRRSDLQVHVGLVTDHAIIDVFLHNKLHVKIPLDKFSDRVD
jgi:hypothetical protein